ncbi:surface_antigen-like_protein (plasmid) [Leishmania braziliensis MHOM/BR/75/M2904]|uniref:Surface_antigen-like_protein n=1 Tax=Leishmania braziliensis MHOM/BR/75/M2904 TaxID=420245 RepID=A0A3P3Z6A0_LEIBR|nr:surface_antigen-like_protein [Leishmania braziliensis MHOM/BR/75/M2904]
MTPPLLRYRRTTRACGLVAAVVLLSALLYSGTRAVEERSMSLYTEAQQLHTRRFLDEFVQSMPGLRNIWAGDDFCAWEAVTCLRYGVSISATNWIRLAAFPGRLPEVSSVDVDMSQVVVTSITMRANGPNLSGTLPVSWGLLRNLGKVHLDRNSLTGSLPPEWCDLDGLVELYLSNNSLTGSLPGSWGKSMKSLSFLFLDRNALTGTLPPEWGRMRLIRSLILEKNRLNGTLPVEWQHMQAASTLSVV